MSAAEGERLVAGSAERAGPVWDPAAGSLLGGSAASSGSCGHRATPRAAASGAQGRSRAAHGLACGNEWRAEQWPFLHPVVRSRARPPEPVTRLGSPLRPPRRWLGTGRQRPRVSCLNSDKDGCCRQHTHGQRSVRCTVTMLTFIFISNPRAERDAASLFLNFIIFKSSHKGMFIDEREKHRWATFGGSCLYRGQTPAFLGY